MHEMLEAYANGDDAFKPWRKAEKEQGEQLRRHQEEYGNLLDDTRIIMTEYFDYYKDGKDVLTFIRKKGKAAEYTFEVEITDGIVAKGKIDGIAQTPNKFKWLVEHKTGMRHWSDDHRWRNVQSGVYIRIIQMLGLAEVEGTCWDFIRSKPPAAPKVLKSGKMSQRGIDTLPTKVREVLKQHKLDVKKFPTMMKSAMSNRRTYFERVFTPIKRATMDIVWGDFVKTAREIADVSHKRSEKDFVRTVDRHCDWCEFESLCRARMQGLDFDFVKKREYEVVETPSIEPDFEA